MKWHRLAIIVGITGIGVGLLEASNPGIITAPSDRRAQYLIGGGLVVYAYFVVESVRENSLSLVSTTDPELRYPAPVMGERLDQVVDHFLETDRLYRGPRVKEGIRSAAIEAIVRYRGRSRSEARALVDGGAWTDDRTAAAFLAESAHRTTSVTKWIRGRLRPETTYRRAITRTVREIRRITGTTEYSRSSSSLRSRAREWLLARTSRTATGAVVATTRGRTGGQELQLTNHWAGISVVTVLCFAIGLLVNNAGVFLAGLVGIGYLAFSQTASLAEFTVSCEREVSATDPAPGDAVSVTLTVENTGTTYVPDVRIIDGVPETLTVTSGSPRIATPLGPGQTVSVSYSILARRGRHEFGPVHVIAKNLSSAVEREQTLTTSTRVSCLPRPDVASVRIPVRAQPTHTSGRTATESGGSGVEFYSSREYRVGDERSRIDWRRLARTGTITTLEYRRERTASVVLAIDTDRSAYVAPAAFADHAVDRSVDAAVRVFNRLVADDHLVGVASFGSDACWIPPGNAPAHREEIHRVLGEDDAFASWPPSESPGTWSIDRFRQWVPTDGQVIVFSPVCSRSTTRHLQRLEVSGVPVTVISPDPTTGESPSRVLGQMLREFQLSDLRSMGIPVVDWSATERIEHAVARETARVHA